MGLQVCLGPQSSSQDLPLQLWGGHSFLFPWTTLNGSTWPILVLWAPWNLRKLGPRGTSITPTDHRLCTMDHRDLKRLTNARNGQILNNFHKNGRDPEDPQAPQIRPFSRSWGQDPSF
ncbi:hypothetical protein O181_067904 [Austropuccinia psidii MF-1]|uniref:Uncharacterized protein n=1 Tax=Austropuccinia psidii MF-1 TaxID=1389203 RepID=A0A9Q3I716_9BASI|nr:hypothetical protein [Austropuccinia psidii MF-1]